MGQRLWASLCCFIAAFATLTASFIAVDSYRTNTQRTNDLQANLASLAEPYAFCVRDARSYRLGPEVRELLTGFHRTSKTELYSGEVGSIDGGSTWKELRKFNPPFAPDALPLRMGKRPDKAPALPLNLSADFELLNRTECIDAFTHDLDDLRSNRLSDTSQPVALVAVFLAFVWLTYRWGLWLVRGKWRTP